jgi:hypothetical protein
VRWILTRGCASFIRTAYYSCRYLGNGRCCPAWGMADCCRRGRMSIWLHTRTHTPPVQASGSVVHDFLVGYMTGALADAVKLRTLLQIRQVAQLRSTTCSLQGLSSTQRSTQTAPKPPPARARAQHPPRPRGTRSRWWVRRTSCTGKPR